MALPRAYSHPGVRLIKPAAQGDYDGLCGLYCLINAVRLVLAPHGELGLQDLRVLFNAGVGLLARRGALQSAVQSCVTEQDWPKLATAVVKAAQTVANLPIRLERPRLPGTETARDTLHRIDALIASGEVPCVFLRGQTRHYTVISGYTPASLILFDSFGYRRVLRSSCGTRKRNNLLHRLHLKSTFTVSVR